MAKRRYLDECCSICGDEIVVGDGWDRGGDVAHDCCLQDLDLYDGDYLPPTRAEVENTLRNTRDTSPRQKVMNKMPASNRLTDRNIAPDGKKFVWGDVVKIHQIGDFDIVEYIRDTTRAFNADPTDHGKTFYHAYIHQKDMSHSAYTLEEMLVTAIALKFDGANTHAADYFFRIVGTTPHKDYAPKVEVKKEMPVVGVTYRPTVANLSPDRAAPRTVTKITQRGDLHSVYLVHYTDGTGNYAGEHFVSGNLWDGCRKLAHGLTIRRILRKTVRSPDTYHQGNHHDTKCRLHN